MGKKTHQKCESNTIKDVIKIRLHMWNMKCNKRSDTSPLCKIKDTTEHIMVCQEGNNTYNVLDKNGEDWQKIVIYNIQEW